MTPTITIRGRAERIYHTSPWFSAGRLRTEAGQVVRFAGPVCVQPDDQVILHGKWKRHPTYGHQFEARSMEYDQEMDTEGLANYLANHPGIKGIGPARARVIAEHFGPGFDRAIRETPEAVARVAGLPGKTIEALRTKWLETREQNQVMTALAGYGLTHHQVTTLVKTLGNGALGILQSDPYVLVKEIPGLGFKRVDHIARQMGMAKDHPGRIRAGIVYCVDQTVDDGHTWIGQQALVREANELLVMDQLDSQDLIARELEGLVGEGALVAGGQDGDAWVASPRLRQMEADLASLLTAARGPNPHFPGAPDSATDPSLNREQLHAVQLALASRICLISGGAGSGKTFTVKVITEICREKDLVVELVAPTGKAARRLEEVVGHPASTIHRALGYNGQKWLLGPDSPIDADVVIVDEVSMVDVPLAWRVFRAIDLDRTAVILVGDHNQLPPVGPGNVLRDLIKTRAIPMVVLRETVRQAGELKANSVAVLRGEVPESSEGGPDDRRAWYRLDSFTNPTSIQDFILEMLSDYLADRLGFDLIRDVQVITPTHKGPLGTQELNAKIQRLIQTKLHGVTVPEPEPGRRPRPLLHDKVIQTRNNYRLDIMNGAIGTVVRVAEDGAMAIDFDGHTVEIPAGSPDQRDIQLAYALTIHKAQGSEFPCVIVVAHKSHAFMHHRNLLYTAVTRAQDTAILIGDRWGMRHCAGKQQLDQRRTFLPMLLDGEVGQERARDVGTVDSPDTSTDLPVHR